MIDARDLMLGNWVMMNDTEYGYFGPERVTCLIEDDGSLESVTPIQVTVDLLERIGFEEFNFGMTDTEYGGDDWHHWRMYVRDHELEVHNVSNTQDRKPWSLHIDNEMHCTVGYGEFACLHELQNLVRVMTGEELPITMDMIG